MAHAFSLFNSFCQVTFVNVSRCQVNIYILHFFQHSFCFDRHVQLPKDLAKLVPKSHLMTEAEWRGLGVQQSQGWIHYMIHQPGIENWYVCLIKLVINLFLFLKYYCRASHFVVSTPHHHTPNGRKGIIKACIHNPSFWNPPSAITCVAIDNYFHLTFPLQLICFTSSSYSCPLFNLSHSSPFTLKKMSFFSFFLGFQKSRFLSLVSVLIEPENL